MPDPFILDLDRERAIRREAGRKPTPLRIGGTEVATLPAELPLDVFAPVKRLNLDFALLFRQALDMTKADSDAQSQRAATDLIVDLLVGNPNLPTDLLAAIHDMGVALMGEEGLAGFLAARPSSDDVGALVKGLFRLYGLSLGEASASLASQESDGTTSTPTSSASTGSTPEASTSSPESPDSSESAA